MSKDLKAELVRLRKWNVTGDQATIYLTKRPDDADMERLNRAISAFVAALEDGPSGVVAEQRAVGVDREKLVEEAEEMLLRPYAVVRDLQVLMIKLVGALRGSLPTPWQPIGWKGPFRAEGIFVNNKDGGYVCSAETAAHAIDIATALNAALGFGRRIMVQNNPEQPSAPDAQDRAPTDLITPDTLAALQLKLTGGSWTTCCCHPDIDNSGFGPGSDQRRCVLDVDAPYDCEFSDPEGKKPITDKLNCQFWRPRQFKRPTRLTISESQALVDVAVKYFGGASLRVHTPPDGEGSILNNTSSSDSQEKQRP
jgi:hypothetical protein